MMRAGRKGIVSERFNQSVDGPVFSDERWAKIRASIPSLSTEADASLRAGIVSSIRSYLTQQARIESGLAAAAAIRSPGKRQMAAYERFVDALRTAAASWNSLRTVYDDRLSDIRRFDMLDELANDAERRLIGIRKLGEPTAVTSPWPALVRGVARCCREVGLKPTASGHLYDDAPGKPTWFQEFMAALDKNLLGSKDLLGVDRKGKQFERDHRAFYAEVGKALHGDRNAGKARR